MNTAQNASAQTHPAYVLLQQHQEVCYTKAMETLVLQNSAVHLDQSKVEWYLDYCLRLLSP